MEMPTADLSLQHESRLRSTRGRRSDDGDCGLRERDDRKGQAGFSCVTSQKSLGGGEHFLALGTPCDLHIMN